MPLSVIEAERLDRRVAFECPGEASGRVLAAGEQHERAVFSVYPSHRENSVLREFDGVARRTGSRSDRTSRRAARARRPRVQYRPAAFARKRTPFMPPIAECETDDQRRTNVPARRTSNSERRKEKDLRGPRTRQVLNSARILTRRAVVRRARRAGARGIGNSCHHRKK
jgi:hypothetical protein